MATIPPLCVYCAASQRQRDESIREAASLRARLEASDKLSAYRGWRLERAETELEVLRRLVDDLRKILRGDP
jgi:hypothetical protein